MTTKDWMLEAAREIAQEMCDNDEATSKYFERQAQSIFPIISKHCPMQDGVTYMPVPRCETCAYWKEARSGIGWCGVKREKIQTTPGANLVTAADFGCTEWKEKNNG